MFVLVDDPIHADVLARIRSAEGMIEARVVELPPSL